MSVVIVALLVAFLGEVVEWDGTSTAILAYGVAIGAVILSMGFVTRYLEVGPAVGSGAPDRARPGSRRRAGSPARPADGAPPAVRPGSRRVGARHRSLTLGPVNPII